jgi:Protein of unknown function (DUF2752)
VTSLVIRSSLFVLVGLAVIPVETIVALPALCPWRTLFGLECPGCGMTRALSAALHGDFAAAMAFNRGVVLVLPAAAVAAIAGVHDMLPRCVSRSLDWIPQFRFRHTAPANRPASTSQPRTT